MELTPVPRLSEAATPIVPTAPTPAPPDMDLAWRQFTSGAQGERDLVERELLGHAMGSEVGLAELRKLDPREFHVPVNQVIAKTVLELADAGRPHDAAAVTQTLRSRPLHDDVLVARRNTQLPRELDPQHIRMGRADPTVVGLGAWVTVRTGTVTRAPLAAMEIRAYYRRDLGMSAARRAWQQYNGALEHDATSGRLLTDGVGGVTKALADDLVSIPRALPEPAVPANLSTDLRLPEPPVLSSAGRSVLRRPA